jgi:hypothetical protein
MKKRKKIILLVLAVFVLSLGTFFLTDLISPNVTTHQIDGSGGVYYDIAEEYSTIIHRLYNGKALSRLTGKPRITPYDINIPFQWPYGGYFAMTTINLEMAMLYGNNTRQNMRYLNRAVNSMRYYRIRRADGFTNTRFGRSIGEDNKDGLATYGFVFFYHSTKDSARPVPENAFFDDNIWVAKEFINAYKLTGDVRYLNEAVGITNWIYKYGYEHDGHLKGGVYWNFGFMNNLDDGMQDQATINVCSLAPFMVNLLELYHLVTSPELKARYLEAAKNIYEFTVSIFRAADALYYDHIRVTLNEEGERIWRDRNTVKWPYNTGTMIQAGALMYETTGEEKFLLDAIESAEAAHKHFGGFDNASRLHSGGAAGWRHSWFNSLLLEGFVMLYNTIDATEKADEKAAIRSYVDNFRDALNFAYNTHRSDDGLISPSWIRGWDNSGYENYTRNSRGRFENKEQDPRQLLLQSSNAWCYAMLAIFYK